MYGPPPDPRQTLAPVSPLEHPAPYLICVALGLLVTALAWRRRWPLALRAWCFALGQTIALTAPLTALLDTCWYGSFPTTDKQGSLLFYLDGVHVRMLLHPIRSLSDPAAALIGIHTGHLWPVQIFDLLLSPMGAFNLMALLSPALAWWAAWLLLYEVSGDARGSVALAFAWGMGLHLFRDLNWYTIEKAGVFWLALYAFALARSHRLGGRWPALAGLIFAGMAWMNLYLAMVGALLGGLALFVDSWQLIRRTRQPGALRGGAARAALWSAALALPLVVGQALLMRDGPQLATPEQFLWERAALDSFTLAPLQWNRLEAWRALHPLALALAVAGAVACWRDGRARFALGVAAVGFVIALGPMPAPGLKNPFYLALFHVVPGFWRVAKPETFFHLSWLMLVGLGAMGLARWRPADRRARGLLYGAMVLVWLGLVRTHPTWPPMTLPVDSTLAPDWQRRVFQAPTPGSP